MAYEQPLYLVGLFPANQDFSNEASSQFSAVDLVPATVSNAASQVALAAPAAGDAIFGILQNNPILGEAGTVVVKGITKAQAGGTITAGQILSTGADGRLIPAATGQYGVARALEAGVAGDVISVLLVSLGKQ